MSPVPQSPVYENFYGGRVTGTSPAKAEDNKLMLTGQHQLNVSHQKIYGGFAQNGQSAAGGISAQAVDCEVWAAPNTVVLQGGAFRENDHLEVYGGRAGQAAGTASALQNHVVLESVSNCVSYVAGCRSCLCQLRHSLAGSNMHP